MRDTLLNVATLLARVGVVGRNRSIPTHHPDAGKQRRYIQEFFDNRFS